MSARIASKISTKIILACGALVLTGVSCAHHRDVRPGADGTHRVVVRGQTKEEAERSALSQAENYCEMTQQHPAFVSEETKYTGSMDEATRDTVRKASTAAMILGGAGAGAGHGSTRTAGGVLGTAGVVGGVMTNGDDYLSDMRFVCK